MSPKKEEEEKSDLLAGERSPGDGQSGRTSQAETDHHLSPKSSSSAEKLSDIELFILCVCLSIIRRERDLIMAHGYDACEILKVS